MIVMKLSTGVDVGIELQHRNTGINVKCLWRIPPTEAERAEAWSAVDLAMEALGQDTSEQPQGLKWQFPKEVNN